METRKDAPQDETLQSAGHLVSIPSRSGMSFVANQLVMESILAGFIRQAEVDRAQRQRLMRVGRKHNNGPVAQQKADPFYRQFDKRKF